MTPAIPAALLALSVLAGTAIAGEAGGLPPEPEGYRMDDYRAPVPATLAGATVVSTERAEALWREGAAFIDVLPRPPRPKDLKPGTIFRQSPHDSVPRALWLPDVGYGALAPSTEAYFRRGIETALGADPERPIVIFCQRDCWMSWNAARRAVALGFRHVHWYPDGTDGWQEAGLPLAQVEPMPDDAPPL